MHARPNLSLSSASATRRLQIIYLILLLTVTPATSFSSTLSRCIAPSRTSSLSLSASKDSSPPDDAKRTYLGGLARNAGLKSELLRSISTLRTLKERDGDFSIDFGVKGGELDKKSRAPQKVDFYSISRDVGKAADTVIEIAEQLAISNPTEEPTLYLGDKSKGDLSPLNGEWKLLFTTAADATFSKNSKRGAASAKNVVDARRGRITNVIDFETLPGGTDPVLKQLNVVIRAKAAGKSRVELRFRYAKAVLTKFFRWRRQWSLYIPVPAPFLTRLIVLISRVFRFGKKGKKEPPQAYFDVLYLDKDLRIHKTGEENLFVQAKESWSAARPLLS